MLFVAFGFLKWFEAEHSDEPRLSPLLLVPVYLGRIGAAVPWKLALYEDEITPNFCLRKLMKRDFRLELPEVDPLALLDDELGLAWNIKLPSDLPERPELVRLNSQTSEHPINASLHGLGNTKLCATSNRRLA